MDPFRLGQRNNEKCFITQREKHVQPVNRTKSSLVTPTAKIIGYRLLQEVGKWLGITKGARGDAFGGIFALRLTIWKFIRQVCHIFTNVINHTSQQLHTEWWWCLEGRLCKYCSKARDSPVFLFGYFYCPGPARCQRLLWVSFLPCGGSQFLSSSLS